MAGRPTTLQRIEWALAEIPVGSRFTALSICKKMNLVSNPSVGQLLKQFDDKARHIGGGIWERTERNNIYE